MERGRRDTVIFLLQDIHWFYYINSNTLISNLALHSLSLSSPSLSNRKCMYVTNSMCVCEMTYGKEQQHFCKYIHLHVLRACVCVCKYKITVQSGMISNSKFGALRTVK